MAADPRFNNWEAALAASIAGQRFTGFANEHPECGFYRYRVHAMSPWSAVGIFPDPEDAEKLVYEIAGKDSSRNHAIQLWSICSGHPVSYDWYSRVVYDGQQWPDVDPGAAPKPIGEGDNSQNAVEGEETLDPIAEAKKKLEAAKTNLEAHKIVTSDEQLASARSLQNKFLEIKRESDKTRKSETQPLYDQYTRVNKAWNVVIKEAEDLADRVLAAINAYGTKKLQQQRAEEAAAAKAEADRIAAEQQKAKEEADAAAAEAAKLAPVLDDAFGPAVVEPIVTKPLEPSGTRYSFGDAPSPTPVKPKPAAIAAPIRPGFGRGASFQPVFKLVEVTDYDALYAHLKNLPEVQTVLRERAQILINKGTREIPGCKIEEQAGLK